MPKATTNKGIAEAAKALQNASKKLRLTPELEDALQQLDSIEITKLSQAAFQRLASLLRQRLLPLHRTLPILGLRYSAAVLVAIFEEKIQPSAKAGDADTKEAWEVVQAALLAGVLDFLEENTSSENQAIVATTLYPALQIVFFLQSTHPVIDHAPDLLYILYQLLSETVTSHGVNQSKLRDQDFLGSKRIGTILSRTRDFLVIEALLELFVKILPAKQDKDDQESRTRFIKEVFSPTIFTCSGEILALFETLSTGDWEDIFLQLIDILARADDNLPQPFEISNFRIHGSKAYAVERIYFDSKGFLANVDEDGQLETFQVIYRNVQNIKVSTVSKLKTSVIVQLSFPPTVGIAAVPESSSGKTLVSFDVHGRDVSRFMKALENRSLASPNIQMPVSSATDAEQNKIIGQTGRKLSKAETTVEFDFDSKGKAPPVSTQDRARDLSRLWDMNNSQLHPGVALTSPLGSRASPSVRLLNELSISRKPVPVLVDEPSNSPLAALHRQTSPEYDSIFGSTDEELTDLSECEADKSSHRKKGHRKKGPHGTEQPKSGQQPGVVLVADSEDEDELPKARKARTRKLIVVSDDEIEELDKTTMKPTDRPKPSPLRRGEVTTSKETFTPEIEFIGRSSARIKPAWTILTTRALSSQKADSSASTSYIDGESRKHAMSGTSHSATSPSKSRTIASKVTSTKSSLSEKLPSKLFDEAKPTSTTGKKRKMPEESDYEADPPSPKRLREEPRDQTDAKAATRARRPAPKRYGRKGRTSSPAPSVIHDVDFDELPAPSTDHPIESKPDGKRKGRAAAMKGKDGKAAPKAKRVPVNVKKEVNDQQDAILLLSKENTRRAKKAKAEERPQVKPLVEEDHEAASKPSRRSARVAKITAVSISNEKPPPALPAVKPKSDVNPEALPPTMAPPQKKVPQQKKLSVAPWQDADFLQKIATSSDDTQDRAASPYVSEILNDVQDVDLSPMNDPVHASEATTGETEDQYEEYLIPTKFGSTSLEIDEAKSDVVMIDLTLDSPKPPPRVPRAPPIERRASPIELPQTRNSPVRQMLPKRQFGAHSSPKFDHPRVSFAPSVSSRPSYVFDWSGETEASSIREKDGFIDISPDDSKLFHGHRRYRRKFEDGDNESDAPKHREYKRDPIPDIVDIIGEITQVVLQKTSRRFDDVRKDLRAAQKTILLETAQELENMVSESTDHFHNLINLESQYATHHRTVVDGFEDMHKIEQELSRFLVGTMQEHNRNSLSKKFSSTLFNLPLPAIIANPKLAL
ncbi:hypothetical protein Hypma_008784 [Hypsizygus marmoreus]|uniref:Uncharacterized protein n=1 Tax=Hypsizygus marmoreus TaxID=39966 RepID=A0A369JSC2_HYPMA|nr:hypothetical protein Hypma_008784 [Hypsizygus marmoreus]